MVKAAAHPDVLVLGGHPCAYFAATLLRQNSATRVTVAPIPGEQFPDRLVAINPALFDLHGSLSGLKRKLELTSLHGVRFLSDDPQTRSEFASKGPVVFVAAMKQVRAALQKVAAAAGADFVDEDDALEVLRVHDDGVDVEIDGKPLRPKLLIVSGGLPPDARRVLGLPDSWEPGVLHRYTYLKCKTPRGMDVGQKPSLTMSLDLKGELSWAWLLIGNGQVQFAVEQPVEQAESGSSPPAQLMQHWLNVLVKHEVLPAASAPDANESESLDLPFAGALAQEDVANRTLLIGPAGGFYTACAEDIYPCCWSAVFAADAAKKALKEKHLQDALQSFRQKWGATLGDYLRGPQQNLRFLLPLVYRNKMMTARLAEAILFGKSVVR